MKRSQFMVLAGGLACLYGLAMIFVPAQMLANMTTSSTYEAALVMRWMGTGLIAIGLINLLARNDPGSTALRAIILGNIALHALGYTMDLKDFRTGFIQMSGIVMGSVVHLGLILGFLIYLRGASPGARPARVAA